MRQNLLKFMLAATVALFAAGWASASTTVTFDATVDASSSLSITKDGVTMTVSSGLFSDTNGFRFYKSSTLTISIETGVLESISFSPTTYTGYPLSGLVASAGNYDGTTGDWTATSSISTVTFKPSAQVRAAKVEVTYSDGSSLDLSPTLTDGFTFWPVMDATSATAQVTITPKTGTLVYYTTNGSDPTTGSTRITAATTITITGTTTVKAAAYSGGKMGEVVSRTYTEGKTYNGTNDLMEHAANGEDVRLFWSDEMNARVLHTTSTQAFIRDNTGAILFYGVPTTPKLAKDQHLAGWIKGRVEIYGGAKQFTANAFTDCDELVIAEPVTEPEILPNAISTATEFDQHYYDLVTLRNVRYNNSNDVSFDYGKPVRLYNRFYLNDFDYPYEGALVDLTGLAIPYNTQRQVAAINMDEYYTYVINMDSAFVAPEYDQEGVKVRLAREHYAFYPDVYTTLCVPFALTADMLDAKMYRYTDADIQSDKTIVKFVSITDAEPYEPIIIKANSQSTGFTLADATLASNSEYRNYVQIKDRTFIGLLEQAELNDGEFALTPTGAFERIEGASNYRYPLTTMAYFGGAVTTDRSLVLSIDGKIVGEIITNGDLNDDGVVNTGDISAIYDSIINGATGDKYDVNNDSNINTGDVSSIYDIILGNGSSSGNIIVKPIKNDK